MRFTETYREYGSIWVLTGYYFIGSQRMRVYSEMAAPRPNTPPNAFLRALCRAALRWKAHKYAKDWNS